MNSYKNKIAAKMRTAQKIVNRTQKLTDVRQGGLVLGDSHDDGGINESTPGSIRAWSSSTI